jgi:hypothetical protein
MRVFLATLLFLAGCVEVLACPGCSYERFAVWYPPLVCIRLAIVPFLTINRLDFVRVLGVFVAYEVFWYYGYRYALWFGHPAVGDGLVQAVAMSGFLLLELGVIGAFLLYSLGKSQFFRRTPDRGLPLWQAALYIPVAIAIRALV